MNKGIRKCKGEEGSTTVNNDWNCSVLDQLRIKNKSTELYSLILHEDKGSVLHINILNSEDHDYVDTPT